MRKTVIFDLDGTVLYTKKDLGNAANYALKVNGFPTHSEEKIISFVGNGIRKLIQRAVPEGTDDQTIDKILNQDFKPYYYEHCIDNTVPYDGIVELLKTLKANGYKIGMASNKVDKATQILNDYFFKDYISAAVGERPDLRKKPEPDMVYEVLKQLNSTLEDTIFVGDSEVDYRTATALNIPVISVLWGYKTKEDLEKAGASVFAQTTEQLLSLIKQF